MRVAHPTKISIEPLLQLYESRQLIGNGHEEDRVKRGYGLGIYSVCIEEGRMSVKTSVGS